LYCIVLYCFLLFLIKNNCGCSIRVYGLYLNEIEKINVFPVPKYLRACYNIKFMSIRTTLELLHSRYLGAVAATPSFSSLPSTWDVLFRRSFWLVEVTFDSLKSSYFSCHFADSEVECVEDIFYPNEMVYRQDIPDCWDRF
jgi:hypothetical protein